jgi:hypothetical protein
MATNLPVSKLYKRELGKPASLFDRELITDLFVPSVLSAAYASYWVNTKEIRALVGWGLLSVKKPCSGKRIKTAWAVQH